MTDDNKSAAEEVKNEVTEEETAEEVVDETETMEDDDDNNDDEEMEDDDDDDDDEDEEDEDDEDDNQRSGGGKSDYRDSRTRGKRYTPYPRNNRAVYHQADDSDRSCRVYVGNLAWEVTWKELKDHMQVSGCEIARADVLASPDGRSKGCGIVEFESEEGAQRAILTLNDSDLMGRQIFVREDRESGSGGGYYTQQPGNGNGGGGGDDGRQGGGEKQDCRVYVGNLSWDVSWQDLKDHMRTVGGEVSYAEVMKGPDGRSKGCGVVEFSSADEAQEAITQLNDSELSGRMIFVREDRETGGARGGGGAGGGGHRGGSSASVYVGNLAYEISWQDLKDHMRQAGNVDQAHVLQSEDGRSKGCGIVTYQNPRDAVRAIRELQNSDMHGRPINVREDREQGSGRPTRSNNCVAFSANLILLLGYSLALWFQVYEFNGRDRQTIPIMLYFLAFIFLIISGIVELSVDVFSTRTKKMRHGRYHSHNTRWNYVISLMFIMAGILDIIAFIYWIRKEGEVEDIMLLICSYVLLFMAILVLYFQLVEMRQQQSWLTIVIYDKIDFITNGLVLVIVLMGVVLRHMNHSTKEFGETTDRMELTGVSLWLVSSLLYVTADLLRFIQQ